MDRINPPSYVRTGMYALSVFVNAVLGVLLANEVSVSVYIIAVVAGYNAVVALMAGANVTPEDWKE